MNDNYCIKPGYQSNTSVNITLESSKGQYWNSKRIKASAYFQHFVYLAAATLIKNNKSANVIDIGCGPGTKLITLVKPYCQRVVGVDQETIIEVCKSLYPEVEFYADNFESPRISFDSKGLAHEFDVIICADVIEHVTDPDIILRYIKNFGKDNTLVIISTPERDILRGVDCMHSPKPEHIREWNMQEFSQFLRARGFSINKHFVCPQSKLSTWEFLLSKSLIKGKHLIREIRPNLAIRWYGNQVAICQIKPNITRSSN